MPWRDSGEDDDEKVKDETCLIAHASSEVCFESSYFSDENSSIDDIALDNEYDKLCKMSLNIITKNKMLKAIRNSLENELRELKDKLSILENTKGVDLKCAMCHVLKIENEKLKDEFTKLNKFKKSTHCLNEMLSNQKPSGDKLGLGFNSFEASSSGTKEIKFVKAQKKLMETCLGVDLEPNEWIKDSGCSKHIAGNQKLFSTYKAYNGGNVVFGSNLRGNIIGKVAQGYNQQEGIDYDETYAPVARLESIRILLAYACALDFKLFQMDVKSAFLDNFINEEVYVAQPLGFIDFEKPNHVYKLKKALYGLKQAPKAWYDRLKAFLIKHEYKMRMVDNTLFTKKKSSNLIIVQIYVDDIIFGLTCQDMCDDFAKIMHDEFEMSMMGELNFFLGLQIKQMEDGIFFNQSKYIKEMLKKFGLEDSKPMKTPMSSDTKLTKDEECESVDSTKYRCTIGTMHLGLWYPKGTGIETVVYAESDHAGDYVDRKSTSGICTFVGCCLTSWFSKKQTALAISTIEAEYVSIGKECQQALWMKQALIDYDVRLDDVPIMCNNKDTIDLSKNPVQHSRTKHIEIRHHFLHDNVQKGHISIKKVPSVDNIADILTKPLKRESFNYLRLGIGMMEHIP
ncbi:retrovirus-related pol polyprotein from transposon TNT 1-94 [Tanacetum coccineum]